MILFNKELQIPMFPEEEMKRRWEAIRRLMIPRQIDCLIVAGVSGGVGLTTADLQYVSNLYMTFGDPGYCILPLYGSPALCLSRAFPQAKLTSWISEIDVYPTGNVGAKGWSNSIGPVEQIAKRLKALNLEKGTIGFSSMQLISCSVYNNLQKELPEANFVEAGEIVRTCSRVKSPIELEFVRKAHEIAEKGFLAMVNAARPGITRHELYGACEGTIIAAGGDPDPLIMCATQPWPVIGAFPFWPSERQLQKGDVILMEIYASYGANYCSRLSLPISLGKPSAEFVDHFEVSRAIYKYTLDLLRPGASHTEINDKIIEFMKTNKPAGFNGQMVIEDAGRLLPWMGVGGHDRQPRFVGSLQPGMVVLNHPGTFQYGGNGPAHICGDTMIITQGKPEELGKLPMDITVI